MNIMKFTGKAAAICFAAGIAAAALSACGDKKTEEPAAQPGEQSQAQAQAAEMQDLNMTPATAAEITEILAFLPDPVATVYGEPIAKKEIIDDLVSQEVPVEIYKSIGEERLRHREPLIGGVVEGSLHPLRRRSEGGVQGVRYHEPRYGADPLAAHWVSLVSHS